jgi:hypothetical protein
MTNTNFTDDELRLIVTYLAVRDAVFRMYQASQIAKKALPEDTSLGTFEEYIHGLFNPAIGCLNTLSNDTKTTLLQELRGYLPVNKID